MYWTIQGPACFLLILFKAFKGNIMSNQNTFFARDTKEIIDSLLIKHIGLDEVKNNLNAIEKMSEVLIKLEQVPFGSAIIELTMSSSKRIVMIAKSPSMHPAYIIVNKVIAGVDDPFSVDVKYFDANVDIAEQVREIHNNSRFMSLDNMFEYGLVDTLDGYRFNINKIKNVEKQLKEINDCHGLITSHDIIIENNDIHIEDNIIEDDIRELVKTYISTYNNVSESITNKVKKFETVLKCEKLENAVAFNEISNLCASGSETSFSKVEKVVNIGNSRHALIKSYEFSKGRAYSTNGGLVTIKKSYVVFNPDAKSLQRMGNSYFSSGFRYYNIQYSLPYNYVDEGRLVVSPGGSYSASGGMIGPDPKVDPEHLAHLKEDFSNLIKTVLEGNISTRNSLINDPQLTTIYGIRPSDYAKESSLPLNGYLNFLKSMVDDYKFIIMKQKADGENIRVTENITYDHANSRLSYKDFSVQFDNDEMMKDRMYKLASTFQRDYIKSNESEEKILDNMMCTIFTNIRSRIFSPMNFSFNVILNNDVTVIVKKEGSFTYLNDIRFNKNEVVDLLSEITCYRNQVTASNFIASVGKVGLSVYMGITTGYRVEERLYRFKKVGRGKYNLIIDDVQINITGKKLLNELYNGRRIMIRKKEIDKLVYNASSPMEYIKYKLIIDDSYRIFMEKSKEYLNEKIAETGSQKIIYHDAHLKKRMDGVLLTGTSGNTYVIAYDLNESLVYMNPIAHDNHYIDGKYICMVDQSSIKSTIGYDSVISKILALKNDSIISSKIYNLDEELN